MNLILSLLFALLVAIFAVNNAYPVEIRFLGQALKTSLVYIIFGSAGLGAVSALLFSLPGRFRAGARTRDLQRQIAQLQTDLKASNDRIRQLEASLRPAAPRQDAGGVE